MGEGLRGAPSRRARALSVLAGVAVVLAGAAMLAYPYVSDYLHGLQQHEVAVTQQEVVGGTDEGELEAELSRVRDYNDRLRTSRTVVTDPFDPSAQTVDDEEYDALLNLGGDGVMGTLYIPAIDVELPIYHTTSDDVLQEGVGHMEGTSLPVGGESTHAVLAGHSGLPSAQIFDRLGELAVGDYFVIETLGEEHAYRVTSIETVLPEETGSLAIEEGRDLVTLVTCTPYGVNTHRLLVHAERCELPAEWSSGVREQTAAAATSPGVPIAAFTLLGVAVVAGLGASWVLARRAVRRRPAHMGRRARRG